MELELNGNFENQNCFTKYDIGVQRDRKIIMTLPVIYTVIRYLIERLSEALGIFSNDYLTLSSLTLTIFIFLFGIFILKRKYEFGINDGYIEYSLKGKQRGTLIKLDAIDIVNPVGVIYFKDIKAIVLDKEESIICVFLKSNNTVFYQWDKVENDCLEIIYKNLTSKIKTG